MIDKQRLLRAVGLFGLLAAVYFLTYSGQVASTDEQVLFDGAHSFFQNGTLELAYTSNLRPYSTQPGTLPVQWLDVEPMQAYLVAPFLWLAANIPGIGLAQAAWAFNILITALTAVVLYYYGLALGYRDRSALVVALLFGLATTAWPYSRLFFREPLFTLLALTCAYVLERWRQQFDKNRFRIGWLLAAVALLIAAISTKEASLLITPVFVAVALPRVTRRLFNRRSVIIATGFVVLIVAFLLVYWQLSLSGRGLLTRLLNVDLETGLGTLPAYLFSPGFSLWAFSPVLLLGLAGAYMLFRKRRMRQFFVPLVMLLSLVLGYSFLQGDRWYGGTGWGPRYLVPVTPFLALWFLPVVDVLLDRRVPVWAQAAAVGLIVQSVFVQIIGVIVPVKAFGNYLYAEGLALHREIIPWQDGVWNPLYVPPVVSAHQTGLPSPIAWVANGSGVLVIPLCLVAAGVAVYVMTRRSASRRQLRLAVGAVVLSLTVMFYGGLRSYYLDPSYDGHNPVLWTVLDKLNAEIRPGDMVLLNDSTYRNFFMNYYKGREPVYVIPDAPGERLEPPKPPEIVSNNPDEQAHLYSPMLFSRLALRASRWWFLTEFSPFSTDRLRPTEHFLVRHYFPARDVVDELTARLILFAPVDAPPDTVPPWPAYRVDADYGAATLVGFDLPRGTGVKPGTMLPVSLLWRHDGWPGDVPPFDYSVNVSLINRDGVTVAQRAKQPVGTFAPMSLWVPGGYYRDNHALEIPADLPPGDYELWVLIYNWSNRTNLSVRNAPAGAPADHVVITNIHVSG